jgi:hypothetical protein
MGFHLAVVADGQVRIHDLPHPLYPKKTRPYIKGLQLSIPAAAGTYTAKYTVPQDMELLSVAFAASGFSLDDYWFVDVGNERILDTIFTKELPESVLMGTPWSIVLPVAAGTVITLGFVNDSATAKRAWWNLHFLR